jgi:hypothetical protein
MFNELQSGQNSRLMRIEKARLLRGVRHGFAACVAAMLGTSAQGQSGATEEVSNAPRTFALVAAFGEHVTYVQGRSETGSRIEPYRRKALAVSDNGLNKVILRALDAAVAQQAPSSRRIHLALDPKIVDAQHPHEREDAAVAAALDVVRRLPQRHEWDEVFVVTPAYVPGPSEGLAPRLHGAGVYVHPVTSGELIIPLTGRVLNPDTLGSPSEWPVSLQGVAHPSRVFIALHYYARVRRYDAKTLELLHTESRFESVKLHDPDADSIHLAESIPQVALEQRLSTMVEQSTMAAARRALGIVEVGPLRPVESSE